MKDGYIDNWLKKADNDLRVVEHEMERPGDEIVTDAACFHCQQAVEKYLKAFLASHQTEFHRTHSIEYLLAEAGKIDTGFSEINPGELSDFGVDVRYPDDFYLPGLDEVKFYYELALKIKALVLEKLSPIR